MSNFVFQNARAKVGSVVYHSDAGQESARMAVGKVFFTPGAVDDEVKKTGAYIKALTLEIMRQMVWPTVKPDDTEVANAVSQFGGDPDDWRIAATLAHLPADIANHDFIASFKVFHDAWTKFEKDHSNWWGSNADTAIDFLKQAIDWRAKFQTLGGKFDVPNPPITQTGLPSIDTGKLLIGLGIVAAIFILPPAFKALA